MKSVPALLLALVAAAPSMAGDLLFHGGPIHSGDAAHRSAEAVLVRDDRVLFVGDLAAAEAMAAAGVARVDLGGAAMFPGFVDAHAHLAGIGERELTLNLEGTASIEDLKARVAARAADAGPGAAIVGRGWIETHWPEKRFPTRHDLDAAAPGHKAILRRADGHALVASSSALEAAGIDAGTEAPFGGEILKDGEGAPTGMLIDAAMALVAGIADHAASFDRRVVYARANEVYTGYGWTGLHNMSVDPDDVPLLESFSESGLLELRVYNSVDPEGAAALFEAGPRRSDNGRIVTRAIKMYIDGALGSRGAALLEPYADAGGEGLLTMRREEAMPLLERALETGIQINTHAIGDRGNRLVLDWYEAAFAAVPPLKRAIAEPRWRIEHAQILHEDDIPRFAELGVIPSMQPSHAIGDLHFAPDRLGAARLAGAYAWRKLIASGSIVAAGSDAPVERGDPLIEFYAAVARRDLEGFSGPGWHPEQAVDRTTALRMFTLWPAMASFAEDDLGTISIGKKADFSIFSADLMTVPMEDIPHARPLMTVIDGKIAWRAEGF